MRTYFACNSKLNHRKIHALSVICYEDVNANATGAGALQCKRGREQSFSLTLLRFSACKPKKESDNYFWKEDRDNPRLLPRQSFRLSTRSRTAGVFINNKLYYVVLK